MAKTFSEARAAIAPFVGSEIVNVETSLPATLSGKGVHKMLSESAVRKSVSPEVHAAAVANIDDLFRISRHGEFKADRANDRNISAVHRFFAPFELNGKIYEAKITVKELSEAGMGNRLYSVEAIEIK